MNTKHTPGPWDWFESSSRTYLATPNRGRLFVMSFARSGMQGATPRFSHWDGIEGGAERERLGGIMCDGIRLPSGDLHPDAKLIAAAPELLEALIEMGDWLAYGLSKPDGAEPTDGDLERCERIAAKARAAIAKATT